MEPTLLVGDHLLVNRLSYVVKLPFTDIMLFSVGNPSRGDVVVFRYPVDTSKDFIKRVIGVGGDVIEIKGKEIHLNGKKMDDPHAHFEEDSVVPSACPPARQLRTYRGPGGFLFCDGRQQGPEPRQQVLGVCEKDDLVGRALVIYFSWNGQADDLLHCVRWERFGKLIQ